MRASDWSSDGNSHVPFVKDAGFAENRMEQQLENPYVSQSDITDWASRFKYNSGCYSHGSLLYSLHDLRSHFFTLMAYQWYPTFFC